MFLFQQSQKRKTEGVGSKIDGAENLTFNLKAVPKKSDFKVPEITYSDKNRADVITYNFTRDLGVNLVEYAHLLSVTHNLNEKHADYVNSQRDGEKLTVADLLRSAVNVAQFPDNFNRPADSRAIIMADCMAMMEKDEFLKGFVKRFKEFYGK